MRGTSLRILTIVALTILGLGGLPSPRPVTAQRGEPKSLVITASCDMSIDTGDSRRLLIVRVPSEGLECPGDGLIVNRDYVLIELSEVGLRGQGFGVGVRTNGFERVTIEGFLGSSNRLRGGRISGFATGVVMEGGSSNVSNAIVERNTGNGVEITGAEATDSRITKATIRDNGANGIDITTNGRTEIEPGTVATSNALAGIRLHSSSPTRIRQSLTSQNGEDGIRVDDQGSYALVQIEGAESYFNADWGIESLPQVRFTETSFALGNGQLKQCLYLECVPPA